MILVDEFIVLYFVRNDVPVNLTTQLITSGIISAIITSVFAFISASFIVKKINSVNKFNQSNADLSQDFEELSFLLGDLKQLIPNKHEIKLNLDKISMSAKQIIENELRLENFIDALDRSLAYSKISVEGNLITANELFLDVLDYSLLEIKEKNFCNIFIDSSDHEKYFKLEEELRSGKSIKKFLRFRKRDGSLALINSIFTPVFDANSNLDFYLNICIDVTNDVHERERIIREFSNRLLRSNKDLENFAYVASHDLKEPLRKILIYGEELQENCSKNINDEGQIFLGKIIDASNRMNNLLSDLLDFSRVSYSGPNFTKVNTLDLVNEVLNDLSISIENNKGIIDLEINTECLNLKADRSQLLRVFQNLISNSLKYHKKDITPLIKISIEDCLGYKVISIEDNGIGFDEKYKDKIFEQFQRLHGKDEYSGTGMGLAIVKKIIENHEGKIEVSSKQNIGSVFKIYLPNEQKEEFNEAIKTQENRELHKT